MKKLFIGILLVVSVPAFADTTVQGDAEVKQYSALVNTTFITISGDAANQIWNDMSYVNIMPANQFQINDMKMGDGINCEKNKLKQVSCHITIDSSEGRIKH